MSEFFVMMLKSPGYIFGPLMMLTGLIATVMCARATFRADRASARRALVWALTPPVLGLAGAIFGAAVWTSSDQVATDPGRARLALFCTIMFGVSVAAVPVLWSLVLLQRRPTALA